MICNGVASEYDFPKCESKIEFDKTEYDRGYNQGRSDKYQEIVSEYMLLTEKQVTEIKVDVIELIYKWVEEQSKILRLQSDIYDDEECFGGWRAMEDIKRFLEKQLRGEDK